MPEGGTTRTAVVGIGNAIMSDDGVGESVVKALQERELPDDVDATHAGTTAFFALEAMDGADRAVVVDAVATGDAPPGAVHRYRYRDGGFDGATPDVLMHDFSLTDALQAGRTAYDLPDELVVVGVEPATTDPGVELSDPVAESVPAVVDAVFEELTTEDIPETRRTKA
ncbi:MAG: hydrogenase maturation protease [Halobacteriales archaeon]